MEQVIIEICSFILDNLNDEITMDNLENTFYYNKYYLIRLFKMYTGYTIKEFINNIKVLKTIDPLLYTNDTILKIALNNGFNSQEYYSEKFKDVIGTSPLKFRKEYTIEHIENINELRAKKEYLMKLKTWENQLINIPNYLYDKGKKKELKKVA